MMTTHYIVVDMDILENVEFLFIILTFVKLLKMLIKPIFTVGCYHSIKTEKNQQAPGLHDYALAYSVKHSNLLQSYFFVPYGRKILKKLRTGYKEWY
jgi:hypothetical protein